MSLRSLLGILITVSLALSSGFILFSARFLEKSLIELLPPTLASQTVQAIQFLVFEQFIGLITFGALISAILFWIFGRFVAQPLKQLVEIIGSFGTDNAHLTPTKLSATTSEIRALRDAFEEFSDKVLEAHQRDTDISRVKSDFISTAAHQLRTPLTGIRWALEALEKEALTPDQMALVKNATDKSHDLVAIVGTLLDISSIESGKYKYTFAMIDLSELVSQVAQDFVLLAQKSNIQLVYEKSAEVLPLVKADRERIKWVLNNLIENAIRYTPPPGTVRITIELSAARLYVRVKDSGIGIEEKDRGNIFERFYRAGNAIAKENQGNGLGLYIARTIATDHGGDLDFMGNEGGPGTTFTLSLPVAS